MKTVYVSIGNSDDKLSQYSWHKFNTEVWETLEKESEKMHGDWSSDSSDPWQNACWCVEIHEDNIELVKALLRDIKVDYEQDAIGWVEVPETEFI